MLQDLDLRNPTLVVIWKGALLDVPGAGGMFALIDAIVRGGGGEVIFEIMIPKPSIIACSREQNLVSCYKCSRPTRRTPPTAADLAAGVSPFLKLISPAVNAPDAIEFHGSS